MTVDQYIEQLPEDRKEAVINLRNIFLEKLPAGFQETIGYGMIGYVVPHSTYPTGYHCDPKQPLPFINIASQKGHLAIYHMGLYANPDMLEWFENEFSKVSKSKADLGKSCLRFKKMENIPYQLIEVLAAKISVEDWISTYEKLYKKASKK